MHLNFSDIIAAISLVWTAVTFGRTVRHRPEASWMNVHRHAPSQRDATTD